MYFKGDFHTHSTESDGTFSPSDLVKLAKAEGIDIMALTDHDTTNGITEAISAGEKVNIKVIPAMELSTTHNNESIHILGYFKDDSYKSDKFQNFLKDSTDFRVKRAELIVEKLKEHFNIIIDYEEVLKNAGGVVARPHIAKSIIDAGYEYSLEYIFNNIINEDSPAYVPNKKLELSDGIKLLKSVNALVVLAHPVLVKKTDIKDLMKFDFDGIEAIYPANKEEDTKNLLKISSDFNKLVTAGSDFHSGMIEDTKHGKLASVSLAAEYLNRFLEELNII
jgi:predicted metal-dependent phosphoesterase TrpH